MTCIVHKAVDLDKLSSKAKKALAANQLWAISPKYDGCHAIVCFSNGEYVGTWSRSGERVLSMDTTAKQLLYHYVLPEGNWAFCGEAWDVGLPFNDISGMFRRHSDQPLQFVPFDFVPFDGINISAGGAPKLGVHHSTGLPYQATYGDRLNWLVHAFEAAPSRILHPRPVMWEGSLDAALAMATQQAQHNKASTISHYDGAVLANRTATYVVGEGADGAFIKCKPLMSETVTVTGTKPALGAKTGKYTVALEFQFNGGTQYVATGLTQEECDLYYLQPEKIVGKRIEVEAMGLTSSGLLREPRFKGIRTDA